MLQGTATSNPCQELTAKKISLCKGGGVRGGGGWNILLLTNVSVTYIPHVSELVLAAVWSVGLCFGCGVL